MTPRDHFISKKRAEAVINNSNSRPQKTGISDAFANSDSMPALPVSPPINGNRLNPKPALVEPSHEPRLPDTYEEAAAHLMPSVYSRNFVEACRLLAKIKNPDGPEYLYHLYAEDLAVCLVLDMPETKIRLTEADADRWGVPVAELYRRAFENLSKQSFGFHCRFADGRVLKSAADDTYDAARLLLPSRFNGVPVRGTPVAMVPHPNVLLIAGDDDPEALGILLDEACGQMKDPLAIGPYIFRLTDIGWEPWTPRCSPAELGKFQGLMLETLALDYTRQQQLLREQESRKPAAEQFFIASHGTMPGDRPDGLKTACAWTKNAPSLLPKTDAIAFVAGTKVKGLVPWSIAAAQMQDELEPMNFHPERYAVRSFPTDQQLDEMVQEAVRRGIAQ
jgi:hypothetical protein